MTHLLPEFRRGLPLGVQLDGELVALDEAGRRDIHLLIADAARPCWDHGRAVRIRPARGGRVGNDDAALSRAAGAARGAARGERAGAAGGDVRGRGGAICGRLQRGLEGVVARRLADPYRPGERGWVKHKNRATARFAEESYRSPAAA